MDREIKKYLRSVKHAAGCPPSRKAEILKHLENDILLYADENDVEDISEIVEKFGSPEEIAKSFIEESDLKAVSHSLKANRRIVAAILAVVLVVGLIVIAINAYNLWRAEQYSNGYFVETIIDSSSRSLYDVLSGVVGID